MKVVHAQELQPHEPLMRRPVDLSGGRRLSRWKPDPVDERYSHKGGREGKETRPSHETNLGGGRKRFVTNLRPSDEVGVNRLDLGSGSPSGLRDPDSQASVLGVLHEIPPACP
jgi:hypothetical protein